MFDPNKAIAHDKQTTGESRHRPHSIAIGGCCGRDDQAGSSHPNLSSFLSKNHHHGINHCVRSFNDANHERVHILYPSPKQSNTHLQLDSSADLTGTSKGLKLQRSHHRRYWFEGHLYALFSMTEETSNAQGILKIVLNLWSHDQTPSWQTVIISTPNATLHPDKINRFKTHSVYVLNRSLLERRKNLTRTKLSLYASPPPSTSRAASNEGDGYSS